MTDLWLSLRKEVVKMIARGFPDRSFVGTGQHISQGLI